MVADIVPERSVAESLVRRSPRCRSSTRSCARAQEARDVLPDALRARGAEVDVLALYETVAEPLSAARARGRARGRLHHLHLLLDRALLPRGGRRRRRPLARDADRLDRPGHERDPARAWAGAACGGGGSRRRRRRSGAARGRCGTSRLTPSLAVRADAPRSAPCEGIHLEVSGV